MIKAKYRICLLTVEQQCNTIPTIKLSMLESRVVDPGGFYPDQDPTTEKKSDTDSTIKKPDPTRPGSDLGEKPDPNLKPTLEKTPNPDPT